MNLISNVEKKYFQDQFTDVSIFESHSGSDEYFIILQSLPTESFSQQIRDLETRYEQLLARLSLSNTSEIFRKLWLSDVCNQFPLLQKSKLYQSALGAVSVIQQPPLSGSKILMQVYLVRFKNVTKKEKVYFTGLSQYSNGLLVTTEKYKFMWTLNLASSRVNVSPYEETFEIFDLLSKKLEEYEGELSKHTVRTWIYVRDIDRHYRDMVRARKDIFQREGLIADNHFIASTGIEGRSRDAFALVNLDALSILGLHSNQVTYLNAFDHMNSPYEYGVTFERGTKVMFSDRSHIYVSGTASINERGEVIHSGNILKQAERTLENIDALLVKAGASLSDMMFLNVYIRDICDAAVIKDFLNTEFHAVPTVLVLAPVCRADWLIEMDGIAVTSDGDVQYHTF